jgi:hypothetical protein
MLSWLAPPRYLTSSGVLVKEDHSLYSLFSLYPDHFFTGACPVKCYAGLISSWLAPPRYLTSSGVLVKEDHSFYDHNTGACPARC